MIASTAGSVERAHLTVVATTDLHGRILPLDYYTQRPDAVGLARAGTLIRQIRRERPDMLLIDCGDTIQGTPLAYYHARRHNGPADPMMLAMNHLHYDAMVIGNHEFNYGLAVLEKARGEAGFPWLAANILRAGSDSPAFDPVLVRDVGGVRVGVVGLTTPAIPGWENPENYEGLEFHDPVRLARHWVGHLRDARRADVVILAVHMGLEVDLSTGAERPGPGMPDNFAVEIAQSVPGIDLILMGHTHRDVPALVIGDAVLAQAGRWGDRIVRADLYLERAGPDAVWGIVARSSRTIPVTAETPVDPDLAGIAEPYERRTQAWLDMIIGHSASELSGLEARFRDTGILDLVHRAQLEAGAAEVSLAASFNTTARVPAGDVTVRDIAGLYIYDNSLVVLELTGAQLKEALEHAARYFLPYEEGRSMAAHADPRLPGYHFDMAEGVEYAIDLRRAPGERIVDLRFGGGALDPERKLRVATNNYRHNGGGGYTMLRDAPVLLRSSTEIRDLIIEWVEKHREIPDQPTGNWRILPE